jgi:putative ABC transport system permease protein
MIGSEVLLPLGRFTHTPRFVRVNHGLIGIGRLKPNVTIDQMLADLGAVARQLQLDYPVDNAGIGAAGEPLKERMVGGIRQPLRVLAVAVGLVLLVACANVANLLLSRAAARQHEFALRVAIGAGRRRVIRQLITESLILAVAGGVLGLGLAWAGVKLLVTLRPDNIPRLLDIHVDATVLAFALGLSLATGFLFGLAPALQLARSEPIRALQEGGWRTGGGRARRRVANGLTVAEVAVALVLLVGAGLLLRSFDKLTRVDPGFDPRNVTAALVSLPERDYPDEAQRQIAFRELLRRVRALPQTRDSALTTDLPVSTSWQTGVTFEGLPPVSPGSEPLLNAVIVSPEYFRTMRIKLLAGRGVEATDTKEQPLVVVVSESVAKRFSGRRALGQRMKQGGPGMESPWLTIVGIVADVRNDGLRTASRGTMYFPDGQMVPSSAWLIVRSQAPLAQILPLLRRETAAIDRNLPLANVTTLDEALDSTVAAEKFLMLMLGIFAALALVLAAVGIYGVIAYSVLQRSQEIGVRIALGARRGEVLGMVVGQAMRLTGIGIVTGTAMALGTGRFIASLLFEVESTDPLVFATAALLVAFVALVSAAFPALRAAQTDPRNVLLHET